MVKVLMKRVPRKPDQSVQHKVMKNWSAAIVESHSPSYGVKVISAKTLTQTLKDDDGASSKK
jgi:hypothetical protein